MTKFNLSELWEIFKDLNSQNDILGVENMEDGLKEFIKQLKEVFDTRYDTLIIDKLIGDKLIS